MSSKSINRPLTHEEWYRRYFPRENVAPMGNRFDPGGPLNSLASVQKAQQDWSNYLASRNGLSTTSPLYDKTKSKFTSTALSGNTNTGTAEGTTGVKSNGLVDNAAMGLGAAVTMFDTYNNNAKVKDLSGIDDAMMRQATITPEASSREALVNQWNNLADIKDDYTYKDIRQNNTWDDVSNTLNSVGSGVMAGAQIGGPAGAIVGGIAGLGASIAGIFTGRDKAKKEAERLNNLANWATTSRVSNLEAGAQSLDATDALNAMRNYAAYGGILNSMKRYDDGGELSTHGSDFSNGARYINAGGTHEENPYEGVQMGTDSEGTPNLVEEGEVVYDDYVFSDRLKPSKTALKASNLPEKYEGLTFARIAEDLLSESKERPNDPISKDGAKVMLQRLQDLQESQRGEEEQVNAYIDMFRNMSPEDMQAVDGEMPQANEQQTIPEQPVADNSGLEMMQPNISMSPGAVPMMGLGGRVFAIGGEMTSQPEGIGIVNPDEYYEYRNKHRAEKKAATEARVREETGKKAKAIEEDKRKYNSRRYVPNFWPWSDPIDDLTSIPVEPDGYVDSDKIKAMDKANRKLPKDSRVKYGTDGRLRLKVPIVLSDGTVLRYPGDARNWVDTNRQLERILDEGKEPTIVLEPKEFALDTNMNPSMRNIGYDKRGAMPKKLREMFDNARSLPYDITKLYSYGGPIVNRFANGGKLTKAEKAELNAYIDAYNNADTEYKASLSKSGRIVITSRRTGDIKYQYTADKFKSEVTNAGYPVIPSGAVSGEIEPSVIIANRPTATRTDSTNALIDDFIANSSPAPIIGDIRNGISGIANAVRDFARTYNNDVNANLASVMGWEPVEEAIAENTQQSSTVQTEVPNQNNTTTISTDKKRIKDIIKEYNKSQDNYHATLLKNGRISISSDNFSKHAGTYSPDRFIEAVQDPSSRLYTPDLAVSASEPLTRRQAVELKNKGYITGISDPETVSEAAAIAPLYNERSYLNSAGDPTLDAINNRVRNVISTGSTSEAPVEPVVKKESSLDGNPKNNPKNGSGDDAGPKTYPYRYSYDKSINGEEFENQPYYKAFIGYLNQIADSTDPHDIKQREAWQKYIQDSLNKDGKKYKIKDFKDLIRLATDKKVAEVHQTMGQLANNVANRAANVRDSVGKISAPVNTINLNVSYDGSVEKLPVNNTVRPLTEEEPDRSQRRAERQARRAERKAARQATERPDYLRYAGILGNVVGLTGNRLDYTEPEAFMAATANPRSVAFTPIGRYMNPDYMASEEYVTPLMNQINATRDTIRSTSNGNSASANAAIIAAQNAGIEQIGAARLQGKQYNNAQRDAALQWNSNIDRYNSQGSMQAQAANMNLNNYFYQRALANAQMRTAQRNAYDQARSTNLTALFDNIANVGRENIANNMANSSSMYGYAIDLGDGQIKYIPR